MKEGARVSGGRGRAMGIESTQASQDWLVAMGSEPRKRTKDFCRVIKRGQPARFSPAVCVDSEGAVDIMSSVTTLGMSQ